LDTGTSYSVCRSGDDEGEEEDEEEDDIMIRTARRFLEANEAAAGKENESTGRIGWRTAVVRARNRTAWMVASRCFVIQGAAWFDAALGTDR
jgi:hypothetical protein